VAIPTNTLPKKASLYKLESFIKIKYFSSTRRFYRLVFRFLFLGNEYSFDTVFLLDLFDFSQSSVLGESDRVFDDMRFSAFNSGNLICLFFDTHESFFISNLPVNNSESSVSRHFYSHFILCHCVHSNNRKYYK
jgi:hypothetical protein